MRPAVLLSALLCLLAAASAAYAQVPAGPPASPAERDEWFFGQRLYGLGYIPENALANAVAQRSDMRSGTLSSKQDSAPTFSAVTLEDSLPSSAITEGRWFSFGPAGMLSVQNDLVSGRVNSLTVDPLNPATIYLAAAGGGVWKSANRGAGWAPLTDRLPSLASGAVAVDPFTGEVWYGTGELNFCRDCYYGAGVYRSADGGVNWTRVNPESFLSSPTSVIAFDPRNQGTIFIARSTALWKSSDGGQSWRVVLRGVVTDFTLNPADSSIAYAAVGNFSGSAENGIYRSTDGGENWSSLSTGLPEQSSMGRIAIAIAPSNPGMLYTLIARSSDFKLNGLYRSLNGGDNWSRMSSLSEEVLTEDDAGQGAFNLCLAVDPQNSGVVYAGGVSLWRTFDFGANWESIAGLHEDPHEIVFDPSDPRSFYLVGDSGVWRSADGGRAFTNLNQGLAVTQFQSVGLHPASPNLAVGGTQDNGTALYRGGAVWEQGRPGDSGAAFYEASDPQVIYTVARQLSVRRSDDGGRTFQLKAEGLDSSDRVLFYPPFLPDPNQPGVLYLGTQRLWQSRDRGDHWLPLSGDITGGGAATISAVAVAPGVSQILYAGTSDGLVRVSQNGGQAFQPTAPLPSRFVTTIAIDPRAPQSAVVGLSGFGSGHVFSTDNFGASWEDISRNLPDVPVNAVLLDAVSPDTIYLGTDIGVFVLLPDGAWAPLQDGLPNAIVLGFSQNTATGLLVAATHGRGAFAIVTGGAALTAPRMESLLNAAGFGPASPAPGAVVSLFGANLAGDTLAAGGAAPLPTSLGGTTLLVNGVPAPLFFASPTQVNFQVPFSVAGPVAELRLVNPSGEAAMRLPRAAASPGIYQSGGFGSILHGSGAAVSESAPAQRGEELAMFASGLGAVEPAIPSGAAAPFSPVSQTAAVAVVVRVNGVAAETRFAGLAPGFVGLYQVNFVVPSNASGIATISLEVNGVVSSVVRMFVAP